MQQDSIKNVFNLSLVYDTVPNLCDTKQRFRVELAPPFPVSAGDEIGMASHAIVSGRRNGRRGIKHMSTQSSSTEESGLGARGKREEAGAATGIGLVARSRYCP